VASNTAPVPPQNLDAEESVLGAMLLAPGAISAVSDVLTPGDFYRESHGFIYQAAIELDNAGEPVDAITLSNFLDSRSSREKGSQLEEIGGRARIHELAAIVPASANAKHYANIIKQAALLRRLIRAGGEISRLGWDGLGDADDLLAEAEKLLSAATESTYRSDFEPLGDGLPEFYRQVSDAVKSGIPMSGLKTGFLDLDLNTTGLYPGDLIVIAARPGVGKSVLAQNIAENVADQGEPVAIFSLEMSKRELLVRSLSRATCIPPNLIRTGKMDEEALRRVHAALPLLRGRKLYVEDTPGVTITQLRARARRLQRQKGLKLLIVDYLQLMLGDIGGTDNRQNEVAYISRSLKVLAKELGIPVIAVSQLNRRSEYREDKRPTLADLRDSGAVEQDADTVLFLYRPEMHTTPTTTEEAMKLGGEAELIVAKQRMGEMTTIRLLFFGKKQTFATPTRSAP